MMKKLSRTALIVALLLTVAGIALAAAALIAIDFDFAELSTDNYEEVTRVIEGEFHGISIKTDIHDVNILPAQDGICRIVAHESEKVTFDINIDSETLYITFSDKSAWYDNIGISIGKKKLDLYLPEAEYENLSISTATGSISVPADCHIISAQISSSTGDINYLSPMTEHAVFTNKTGAVNVSGLIDCYTLNIESAMGAVKIKNIKIMRGAMDISTTTGNISASDIECKTAAAESTTGSISLENVNCLEKTSVTSDTGNISLLQCIAAEFNIETDTGDVKFDLSDADGIKVKTDTGDVMGTLLSDKLFSVHSDTGNIDIPASNGEKRCDITTDTGDIRIDVNRG